MELRGKKITVTGGAGFLGRHVVAALKDAGVQAENILVPRSSTSDLRLLSECEKAVRGADLVIHLAATVGGIGANKAHPGKFFYDNAVMGIQLMEAARVSGVSKFVTISTACAYPKITAVPFKEEDLWKGYPEETNAPYGLAKKMLLVMSHAYRAEYGFNAIYLIPANMYGPGDNFDPETSHVVPALIRRFDEAAREKRAFVEAWGTGTATREFLYVEDAARGIVMASIQYDKPEPMNIGSGRETSIKELTETIARLTGFTGEVKWDTSKPDGQPRRALDASRALQEIGYRADTDLEEGLRRTVEWYRRNLLSASRELQRMK